MSAIEQTSHFAAIGTELRSITRPQLVFLREAKKRGGEIDFRVDKAREDVKAMIADLITKGFGTFVEYTTHALLPGKTFFKLTDRGHALVEKIDAAASKPIVQVTL